MLYRANVLLTLLAAALGPHDDNKFGVASAAVRGTAFGGNGCAKGEADMPTTRGAAATTC